MKAPKRQKTGRRNQDIVTLAQTNAQKVMVVNTLDIQVEEMVEKGIVLH